VQRLLLAIELGYETRFPAFTRSTDHPSGSHAVHRCFSDRLHLEP